MIVASILQMVSSVTPVRTLINCGGSLVGSAKPGGRGRLVNSSTVASTMPGFRSTPLITFLPTLALSGSWPVLTGQRSVPGLSSCGITGAASSGAAKGSAAGATPSPAAFLILAATAGLTTLRVLTSVIGPASPGGAGGGAAGGTGGFGFLVTGTAGAGLGKTRLGGATT